MALLAALLLLAVIVSRCGALDSDGADQQLVSALQGAGYQTVGLGNDISAGTPSGGLVTIQYTKGPTGNVQQDARHAEKIVWDSYPYRFGGISITQFSATCAPACPSHDFSVTYPQLAGRFGPRPRGLGAASLVGASVVPGVLTVVGIAAIGTLVVVALKLKRSRSAAASPPAEPPWPAGPTGAR